MRRGERRRRGRKGDLEEALAVMWKRVEGMRDNHIMSRTREEKKKCIKVKEIKKKLIT